MGKSKPRVKMPIGERAKQFAPFSPLNGLHAALAECEKMREKRRYPDEDALVQINRVLNELKKGDTVLIFYYNGTEMRYEQIEGQVNIIDDLHERLFICDKEISFKDFLEIEIKKG